MQTIFESIFIQFYRLLCDWQKEDKIRLLRQRLAEREASGTAITVKGTSGQSTQLTNETQSSLAKGNSTAQGKDALIIIQPDPATVSDFDSAIGGGLSTLTRSSRASQSDFEFSESYL